MMINANVRNFDTANSERGYNGTRDESPGTLAGGRGDLTEAQLSAVVAAAARTTAPYCNYNFTVSWE